MSSVVEDFTLGSARVVVAEFVQEFILVAIVPIRELTLCLRIPLILFMVLIGPERNLKLFVLVSDVSHSSVFGLVWAMVHDGVQIVKVLLTMICFRGAIRSLFL